VKGRELLLHLAGSAGAAVLALTAAALYLPLAERRPGVVLRDPVLEWLPILDIGAGLVIGTYAVIVLTVIALCADPDRLALGLQAYALMLLMRLAGIWLVPLDPPDGMVLLYDPVVGLATGVPALGKDLFFSGHVATLALGGWAVRQRPIRWIAFGSAGLVALGLLLQHVHYTVDVAAAPFMAYSAWVFVNRMNGGPPRS
jgi:hypothetical protein